MISALLSNTGDMALKRRASHILSGLEISKNDNILDIGCGDGYYLHLISNISHGLKLTGTDFDMSGLVRARKNISPKISLVQGDLMGKLPFKPGSFNKAVMSEVAEHLPNDVKGLQEVRRVLKKGGTLHLTVPCRNYPLFWDPLNWVLQRAGNRQVRSGFFAGIWNQHERLYTKKQIVNTLEKVGFKIEEAKCLTFWCLPFNHYIVNLVARMLAANTLSGVNAQALSKYSKSTKKPILISMAFKIANLIDSLNDIWQPSNIGVSVYVRARK
ncbi:class I SAM-dependent methyltransferase [Candidatus Microgenomates bacterium]|nr:MAG: class I SAM-dependent methyltransferase [Candidatus Microgenomates bacterium]